MNNKLFKIIAILSVFLLHSCASIFNSQQTYTRIVTNQPSKLTINGVENKDTVCEKEIWINRSKKSIEIKAESETNKKTIIIKAKNSFMYWVNLYNYGIGMLIDKNNPKRYTYPRTIVLNLNDTTAKYKTYIPYKKTNDSLKNILKFSPVGLLGLVNPGLELSYERKTSSKFSTQFMGAVLFDLKNRSSVIGFRTSIEEKYFYRESAPVGPYVSFEINYLQKRYYDTWNFGIADVYYNPDYKDTNYSQRYGINKKTLSLNLKWGYQKIIKRFVIDFSTGLGVKYRDVCHFDRINPNDEMEGTPHPNVYLISNKEANEWTISIPFNISIGWIF